MFILICAFAVNAQNYGDISVLYIINGLFYNEIPKELNETYHADEVRFIVSSDDKSYVTGIYIPSMDLTYNLRKQSISSNRIPDSARLLDSYKAFVSTLGKDEEGRDLETGYPFPEFSAYDTNGKKWTLTDFSGMNTVYVLWRSGNRRAKEVFTKMAAWKDTMPEVLFVSATPDDPALASVASGGLPPTWINLVGDTDLKRYSKAKNYPIVIVTDKDGTVRGIFGMNSPDRYAGLKKAIRNLR